MIENLLLIFKCMHKYINTNLFGRVNFMERRLVLEACLESAKCWWLMVGEMVQSVSVAVVMTELRSPSDPSSPSWKWLTILGGKSKGSTWSWPLENLDAAKVVLFKKFQRCLAFDMQTLRSSNLRIKCDFVLL